MRTEKIHFTKMHGLGNDYIYVNTMCHPIKSPEECAREWSAPHTGIGSDGLVLIGDSKVADFSMRIFNADGSEAMMCGNASRCIGKYVYEHHLTEKREVTLDTRSGIKRLLLQVDEGETVTGVTVDMGTPLLADERMVATADGRMPATPLRTGGTEYMGTFVSMGNPHLVIFVPDVESVPLSDVGPIIECHPLFPQRINVEFAEIKEEGHIRMRVWERGSGITQACGTGACATAVAAISTGRLCGREADISMDGGTLHIKWDGKDNPVWMTGPAVTVFEGDVEVKCE